MADRLRDTGGRQRPIGEFEDQEEIPYEWVKHALDPLRTNPSNSPLHRRMLHLREAYLTPRRWTWGWKRVLNMEIVLDFQESFDKDRKTGGWTTPWPNKSYRTRLLYTEKIVSRISTPTRLQLCLLDFHSPLYTSP